MPAGRDLPRRSSRRSRPPPWRSRTTPPAGAIHRTGPPMTRDARPAAEGKTLRRSPSICVRTAHSLGRRSAKSDQHCGGRATGGVGRQHDHRMDPGISEEASTSRPRRHRLGGQGILRRSTSEGGVRHTRARTEAHHRRQSADRDDSPPIEVRLRIRRWHTGCSADPLRALREDEHRAVLYADRRGHIHRHRAAPRTSRCRARPRRLVDARHEGLPRSRRAPRALEPAGGKHPLLRDERRAHHVDRRHGGELGRGIRVDRQLRGEPGPRARQCRKRRRGGEPGESALPRAEP